MARLRVLPILCWLMSPALLIADEYVTLSNPAEFIDEWAGGGLYVCGSVGLSDANSTELAQWMERYPNWTVLLLERAEGMSYVDREGQPHYDTEALEFMAGHELVARTRFGSVVDERTGLSYGAILYVSFDRDAIHRRVGYYAGDTFDAHGLGEGEWSGNLDRLAIRPLQNGRRVAEAVRSTIANIEKRLTSAIQRAQRERQGVADRVREEVRRARVNLDGFRSELSAIRSRVPEATVGFLDPDVGNLVQELNNSERAVEQSDFASAERSLKSFEALLARKRRPVERFLEKGRELSAADDDLDRAAAAGLAAKVLAKFRSEVGAAREAWYHGLESPTELDGLSRRIGSAHRIPSELRLLRRRIEALRSKPLGPRATDRLARVASRVDRLGEEFERGEVFPEGRLRDSSVEIDRIATSHSRRRAKQRHERWTQVTSAVGGVIVLVLAAVLGYWRIRRVRERARRLFAEWDALLTAKTTSLWELETKKDALLGSIGDESRFDGESAEIARVVRQRLGELFVMRSLARRHHDSSRAWLEPHRLVGRLSNLVLARNFERVIRRLSNERVVYDRETGLPEIVRERDATPEIHVLAADLEDVQPFSLSFDALMDAFNARAEECLLGLASIERATRDVYSAIRELDGQITRARQLDRDLDGAACGEPDWRLPQLAEFVTHVLDLDAGRVDDASTRDPVKAVRVAREAVATAVVVNGVVSVATGVLGERVPMLRRRERDLELPASSVADVRVVGIRVDWIGTELSAVAAAVGAWIQHVGSSRDDPAPDLDGTISALETRVSRVCRLDLARRQTVPGRLVEVTEALVRARRDLAIALSLPPESILVEGDPDPDRVLAKARSLHHNSAGAITAGELDRAERDLDLAFGWADRVFEMTERTREVHANHDVRIAAARDRVSALTETIPDHDATLRALERDYASEVLQPHASDRDYPGANETLADNIDEASRHLAESGVEIEHADVALRAGRILESDRMLDTVFGQCGLVEFRLAEIRDRRVLVDEAEAENRGTLEAIAELEDTESRRCDDFRTTMPTKSMAREASDVLRRARELDAATPRQPFSVARALRSSVATFDELSAAVDRDWSLYAEAGRSADSARRAVAAAEREARYATTDGVPDSAATRQVCRRIIEELGPRSGELRRELEVPHADWLHLDARADALVVEATRLRAILDTETTRGRRALDIVVSAHQVVRAMQLWSGSHGVRITGSPGRGLYRAARDALEAGEYQKAERLASRARRAADNAVRDAERRVERERRAAVRRRRAAQRRRVAQFLTSSGGSSGLGSSGGSGGRSAASSFSTGSGFSSSTVGSSSSGFSSSNW